MQILAKWTLSLFVAILIGSCGTTDPGSLFQATVIGYDAAGKVLPCPSFDPETQCPFEATEFTNQCLNAGHAVLRCADCVSLCSSKI